jgi:alkanesulfonate monooxygenase SsuD/methylene tetrahydromethanopterin reductase-like flavin-dependent oxidoreductase (luciferase family)
MIDGITFGCTIPLGPPEMILRYAVLAEENGYDSIWLPDHVLTTDPSTICADTWAVLPAIGMKTQKVKLCDGVSDPYRRIPSVLAQTVATVDQLTNGRVVLGLGAGEDMNLRPFGLSRLETPARRRGMLVEAVHVIRKLWTATVDRPANFEGTYFKLRDAHLSIFPKQSPHPPIYIGAMGSKMRQLVGAIGDGYYPLVITTELFPKFMDDIEKGARTAGRDVKAIDRAARVFAAVSDDPEEARSLVIERAKRHLILDGGAVLREMGVDLQIDGIISTMPSGLETKEYIDKLRSQVPEKAAEAISIFGTVDDCIERVEEFIKVGATQLITFTTSEETIVRFGEVIKHFREE